MFLNVSEIVIKLLWFDRLPEPWKHGFWFGWLMQTFAGWTWMIQNPISLLYLYPLYTGPGDKQQTSTPFWHWEISYCLIHSIPEWKESPPLKFFSRPVTHPPSLPLSLLSFSIFFTRPLSLVNICLGILHPAWLLWRHTVTAVASPRGVTLVKRVTCYDKLYVWRRTQVCTCV